MVRKIQGYKMDKNIPFDKFNNNHKCELGEEDGAEWMRMVLGKNEKKRGPR